MQIPPPDFRVTLGGPAPRALDWRPGQLLEALVVRSSPAADTTRVRIDQRPFELRLPAAPPEGSRIRLQVMQTTPGPVLRLIPQPATDRFAASSVVRSPVPPRGLIELLPVQGGQTPLLATLSALLRQPTAMSAFPVDVRKTLETLIQRIPTTAQTTQPGGLRQVVQNSGLFHEAALHSLAQGQSGDSRPVTDLKSALLSLAARLHAQIGNVPARFPAPARDIPPPGPGSSPVAQGRVAAEPIESAQQVLLETLRARTEQAVARLALHQWNSVESVESGQLRWLLELPLRSDDGIDLVHLLLEREPAGADADDEPVWRVELALELPELGPLHIRITVSGDRVGATIWAREEATVNRVRRELPQLRESLENRHLRIRDLGCHHGEPPKKPDSQPTRPFLDDHA